MTQMFFFDVETTGLADFRADHKSKRQPHIVQFAGKLINAQNESLLEIDTLVKPEGDIEPGAFEVHGISYERAMEEGAHISEVLADVYGCIKHSSAVVGFNIQFDMLVLLSAYYRHSTLQCLEDIQQVPTFCAMHNSTPICKILATRRMRSAGRYHYKNPKLEEAYEFFTGKPLEGAHDAMTDVNACIEVFWGIQKYKAKHKGSTP